MNQDNDWVMRMGRIRFLLLLICVSVALWIAFAKLVVPSIIESAYRGESLAVFNRMIRWQHINPVGVYLQIWDGVTVRIVLYLLAFWLGLLVTTSSAFFRRFVGEATPGTLGAIRAWTCTILLLSTLWEDLSSIALLPFASALA